MATSDSADLASARKELEQAIQKFVSIKAEEQLSKDAYVMSWIAMAEFISTDDINEGMSHSFKIIKDGQLASTSYGLVEIARRTGH